jgi:hypothetical protein
VDGFRRYAEDPDSRWSPGPAPYGSGGPEGSPGEALGVPEQPSADELRYPLSEPVEPHRAGEELTSGAYPEPYRPAGGFVGGDQSAPTSGFGFGPPVDPSTGFGRGTADQDPMKAPAVLSALDAIRVPLPATVYPPVPGGSAPSPDAPPAATEGGPLFGTTIPNSPPRRAATTFVPPMGVRTADGPARPEAAGSGHSAGAGVYRTRRPVLALVFAVVTGVLMIPVLRLLVAGAFASRPTAGGIVPAVLLTLGLPLTGVGLYAVAGAGRTVDREAWLRPPVGYLTVGLVLLVAAALATA